MEDVRNVPFSEVISEVISQSSLWDAMPNFLPSCWKNSSAASPGKTIARVKTSRIFLGTVLAPKNISGDDWGAFVTLFLLSTLHGISSIHGGLFFGFHDGS